MAVRSSASHPDRAQEFIARPRRAVWVLSLPVMVGMAVQTLYSVVDMIFIGWLGGDAIAALTFNMPLVFFSVGITFGLGTGATSVIAQFVGADDKAGADNTAEHALLIGLVMGIIVPIAGLLGKRPLFALLGADPVVLELAVSYFSIIATGFIFMILNVQFRAIMTGEGDTRTPILFQVGGTILNLLLDPLLIFGAGLGIAGAALATILSQLAVLCCFLYFFFLRHGSYVDLRPTAFSFSSVILLRILRIGVPASASMIIMASGNMVLNRIISTFGSNAVAAFGIGDRLNAIFFLPMLGLASSMVTLTGMFLGAGRQELIRSTLHYALGRAQLMVVGLGVIFYVLSPYMLTVFTRDQLLIDTAVDFVRILVFAYPFTSVGMITSRVFQGLGDGIPSLLLTALRVILLSGLLAWTFVFVLGWGLRSVWLAIVLSSAAASVIAYTWLGQRLRRLAETGTAAG